MSWSQLLPGCLLEDRATLSCCLIGSLLLWDFTKSILEATWCSMPLKITYIFMTEAEL